MLTLMGAVALLICLSYPDAIMPPSVDEQYVEGFSIYKLKPVLWVAPLVFMELVSSMGRHRNAVWFFALNTVFAAGFIAWPVLQAHAPEWVERTLPFEDGKLPVGLGYLGIIIAASVAFRRVLLGYLFRKPSHDEVDTTMMEADVLDPANARTVQEIRRNPAVAKPRFLFGDADMALIDRFFALVRQVQRMRCVKGALWGVAGVALALWFWLYPQPDETEALQRDLSAMYEAKRLPDGSYRATHRAVHAAYRALKRLADDGMLDGLTFEQAENVLGVRRAPEAYRRQLLDRTDIPLPSVDDMFESRMRFFTVQDGRRIVVLYVRTDASDEHINIAEVQDAGWNAVADEKRRRFGQDVSARSFGF